MKITLEQEQIAVYVDRYATFNRAAKRAENALTELRVAAFDGILSTEERRKLEDAAEIISAIQVRTSVRAAIVDFEKPLS